ncbi:enoyl-CoA hydratase/isomerase family protein [Marinobacter sp. SS21]|uniref:enoyl-CoA hydratase/isomerase family protein n=1 Tax=Marinobacter sp. SS21 TaxID=2979460 RepID=UPI0023305AAE|nr:enoyl-CoA hydratase/isomerase family protein [Marinobacter sp. SS21]MDC0662979.1 enoyl-CoA hydratase/isomerase family protein [Marinobacter sp. SS21]
MTDYQDIAVAWHGHVAEVEIRRPPYNFFDTVLIAELAECFAALEQDDRCRAIVLAAEGKAFCAGADFSGNNRLFDEGADDNAIALYRNAVRLFQCRKPVVGAIQGAAIGGGLGLALVPDFRVVAHEARFAANFVQLGIHPGFGISLVLPRLIGQQKANLMLLTGRRINGQQAYDWGLADVLTDLASVRQEALALAQEIAQGAPLAVESTRATLRAGWVEALQRQTEHEFHEQAWLARTEDHQEGTRAVSERRPGRFGRS